MAKRVTKLKLTEISSVDNPAQPHATMSIMKRHDPLAETIKKYYGEIVREREPIKNFDELLNLRDKENKLWKAREELWPIMDAFRETVNNIVVDVNLSLDSKMAQIESNVNSFVAAVREKVPDVEEELTKFFKQAGFSSINPTDNTENQPVSDLEKTVKELETKLAKAEAEATVAKAVSTLTDVEKAHYNTLDDAGKTEFLAKSADERTAIVEKVAKADESVELAGQTIRKSEVGAATFAVLKSQAEEIKKANERIAKAEAAAEMAELRKRADDEFGKVVGSTDDRAKLLKALKDIGGEVEAYGLTVLKAANETGAFEKVGKREVETADKRKAFDEKVNEIRKRDNISEAQAIAKAVSEHPELVNAE